jgi:hypothetical protein
MNRLFQTVGDELKAYQSGYHQKWWLRSV